MAAGGQELFRLTAKFKESIDLMLAVDKQKFPLVLGRILRTLHLKTESAFSEAEEQQLVSVLGLSLEDLHSLFEACSFIFEQCVYYAVSANTLASQLSNMGLDGDRVKSFHKVWEEEREKVLSNFRELTLMPSTLSTSAWTLHLQISQSTYSRVKSPSAIFEFNLHNREGESSSSSSSESPSTSSSSSSTLSSSTNNANQFKIEFDHDQLYDFYKNLETIQSQLDSLQ